MSLKSLIRAIVPPILWQAIRPLKKRYRTFRTWDEAARQGTYENDTLTRFRLARAGNGTLPDLEDNALRWLVRLLPAPVSIVDFGGATGEVGLALIAEGAPVSYTVVEHPALVAAIDEPGPIRFASDIPPCDVFFTSGALQCIADPYAVLERGFASAGRAVVLKRNYFSEREVFRVRHSRLFENGSGPVPEGFSDCPIAFPSRTVSEAKVREIAARHGFRLFWRAPESESGITVPEPGVYAAQLVFLK